MAVESQEGTLRSQEDPKLWVRAWLRHIVPGFYFLKTEARLRGLRGSMAVHIP